MALSLTAHRSTVFIAFILLAVQYRQLFAVEVHPLDARPVVTCFRCIPSEDNRFCANEFVDDNQVDCLPGRCIVMSTRFKRPSDVVRLYDCDFGNIVDMAFQLFVDQNSDEMKPDTCKLINFNSHSVLDILRDSGMTAAVLALSRNGTSQVREAELCACESSLCNSALALDKITQLPRGASPAQPLPPLPHGAEGCSELAWYWIVLIVIASILALLLAASLAVWLYMKNRHGYSPGAQ